MRKLLSIIVAAVLFTACTTIDCPQNNAVYVTCNLYGTDGKAYTLDDTLTIRTKRTDGKDTILLNRQTGTKKFSLPVSYAGDVDCFVLEMCDSLNNIVRDTIMVSKTNIPHFESVDCGPSFFHTIKGVATTYNKIESVKINHSEVNYDATKEHIRIYFKSDN
ncbi:DUF6452 family protein [Prevotella sp. OH937_COT-195]|uniref:DUF6452 family protein n=1 Tax=Prevotella sp. OH937_COT-195 TaxID=2491051 RepID=UPI000F654BDC|nr:DUF6452 family protein [Prevotella sp. OH937_COT-195]RRD03004.1 hypothetical protein EII32_00680 [Prevotella sp. OH937_COT-195]